MEPKLRSALDQPERCRTTIELEEAALFVVAETIHDAVAQVGLALRRASRTDAII
jgi:hypothetical protein